MTGTVTFQFTPIYCGLCNQRVHYGIWNEGDESRCNRFFTKVRRAFLTKDETAWARCKLCIDMYGPKRRGA